MKKTYYLARVFLSEGNPGEWGDRDFINADLIIPAMICGGMPLGYGIYIWESGKIKSVIRFQSQYDDTLLRERKIMHDFSRYLLNQLEEITLDEFKYTLPVKTYTDADDNKIIVRPLTRRQKKAFEKEVNETLAQK